MIVLEPKNKGRKKAIVYLHGGGWVACNAEVLLHSMTPLCRQGFTVYCPNYMRSNGITPGSSYPSGLISVLTCLAYLKSDCGVETIGIFGDSAGGSLALMAGCFITNPGLLNKLLKLFPEYPKRLGQVSIYPKINSQASICGLLDRISFMRRRLTNIYFAENLFMILMCKFCLFMYETDADELGPNIDDI